MTDDAFVKLRDLLDACFSEQTLILATLSSPKKAKGHILKVSIRPILIKEKRFYQVTRQTKEKALHENLSREACQGLLHELIVEEFKQSTLQTEHCDYHILTGKKGNLKILEKPPTKPLKVLPHNRPKHYLIEEGAQIPFLVKLGIMNKEGKVFANKRDKFKQINRFLEIVETVLPSFKGQEKLHIFDFGCGKAYLTFALHHFLRQHLNLAVEITGIDLKEEVIANCKQLAEELHCQNLHFALGDINTFRPEGTIDLMVALHACDTATDAALEKAVEWRAKAILSVPCCQHELLSQVTNQALKPLLEHGILKEKFSALATDAARGKLLEILGYQVEIMEFIDPEHTPKNILIRAILKSKTAHVKNLAKEYLRFKDLLAIYPSLEKRFSNTLKPIFADALREMPPYK